MSQRTSLFLLVLAAIMIVAAYSANAVRGQQRPVAESKTNDAIFKDQIVLLEYGPPDADGNLGTVALQNAHISKLGQREFLEGESYVPEGSEEDWSAGLLTGVPCNQVIRYQSMTLDEYKVYLKKWEEATEN